MAHDVVDVQDSIPGVTSEEWLVDPATHIGGDPRFFVTVDETWAQRVLANAEEHGAEALSRNPLLVLEEPDGLAHYATRHDVDFGYALGAQYSPLSWVDIGLAYNSSVQHNIKGNAHFDLPSSIAGQTLNGAVGLFSAEDFRTKLKTPGSVALGTRVSLNDQVRLLASVRVMMWSTFDVVALNFNDGVTPPETSTQNWRDSVMASIGAEYQARPSTTVRAGFMYDQSPVRDRLAIARIPDGDRYWLSFGLSQAITSHIDADLGFAYAIFADRKVDLNGARPENQFRGSLKADFTGDVVAASMGVRWKF